VGRVFRKKKCFYQSWMELSYIWSITKKKQVLVSRKMQKV